jgi:sulfite reductase alpha subunit-like flavoprotein
MYLGFYSDFLATLPLESNVVVKMRPAPSFRLPPETPILMVAGGTGIAPFKGFVDHLAVAEAGDNRGDAWLIVGCQTKGNQLYRQELEHAAEHKTLTKYLVGYSHESTEPKRYVDGTYWAFPKSQRCFPILYKTDTFLLQSQS